MKDAEIIIDQEFIDSKSQEFINSCSWFLMRKVVRVLTNHLNDMFKDTGILSTQLGALAIMTIKEQVSISELAQDLLMDQTTATRNILNLEKQGLVKMVEGEDKRFKIVTLTDEGKKTLQKSLPIWDVNQKIINETIGDEKIQLLNEILHDILHMLHQE